MSEEQIRHGLEHEPAEFEREDLSPKGVFGFMIALGLAGVAIYFILNGAYFFLDASEKRNQPVQNPLTSQGKVDTRMVTPADIEKFPQPRLEKNERIEINDFRLQEEQTLHSYGWVDPDKGVVRIPVERAMELVAKEGLPCRSCR